MYTFRCSNVNEALARGLDLLDSVGVESLSRNGSVIASPEPVCAHYERPWERVLFSPLRNANPFFHFMESLWMLAGRGDVVFPATYVKQIRQYSDNGETFHGAYGHRWRNAFGQDQLLTCIKALRVNPLDRRVVLQMWSAGPDLASPSKDVPCNTHAYFDLRGGKLNMTVCNRSNDLVWGAYGANAVHFSILQQFVADQLRVQVGWYEQISNNLHVYTDKYPHGSWRDMMVDAYHHNYYDPDNHGAMLIRGLSSIVAGPTVPPVPLFICEDPKRQLDAFGNFCSAVVEGSPLSRTGYPVIDEAAAPMHLAWMALKYKDPTLALQWCGDIALVDWRVACRQWIERRINKAKL